MKKQITIRSILIFSILIISKLATAQTRYLTQVFNSVNVQSDIVYAHNVTVLISPPVDTGITMDVYTPAGDSCTSRPVVIFMHAGTYLPIIYNQGCVGTKTDSSLVEICTRLARMGYVAVSMDYRLGWAADAIIAGDYEYATGTLFQAVYRGIQDAKCCIRYLRANATTFGIDTNMIILGGAGAGANIAINFAGLHDTLQLWNPNLIGLNGHPPLWPAGSPYVDYNVWGDFDGFGGTPGYNDPNNTPGHTSNANMIVSLYGNLADSTWVDANYPPTVAFHPSNPPTGDGPYYNGDISALGHSVLSSVSGPAQFIPAINALGANDILINSGWPVFNDPYSMHAYSLTNNTEALCPFPTATPQADMWDWYDSTTICYVASVLPGLTAADGTAAYQHSITNNPNMSHTQAMLYIDTIIGYLTPRIVRAMNVGANNCLINSISENEIDNTVSIFPNPSSPDKGIKANSENLISSYVLTDMTGKKIFAETKINDLKVSIDCHNLHTGIYFLEINTNAGKTIKRIVLQ